MTIYLVVFFFSDSAYLRLPIYLILFAPRLIKYFLVSLFEEKHKSNLPNTFLANFENRDHLLNDFFVILPFRRIIGICFLFKLKIIFGQISESIKKETEGLNSLKKFFCKKFISKIKLVNYFFFNFNFCIIFEELSVFDVTKICFIFFFIIYF